MDICNVLFLAIQFGSAGFSTTSALGEVVRRHLTASQTNMKKGKSYNEIY